MPDHWYFYVWDDDWGPAFIKLNPYAPFGLWVMANGHEWASGAWPEPGSGSSSWATGCGPSRTPPPPAGSAPAWARGTCGA
ncbi:MAG: hypothetical protein ACRD0A_00340 [Acidimicrobiales bacterium]